MSESNVIWGRFLSEALQGDVCVTNLYAKTEVVSSNGLDMPVTVNTGARADTSWVASLRNSYGPYAREEAGLVNMSRVSRAVAVSATYAAERLLSYAGLSGGLYLNNWLLSTNLHSKRFDVRAVLDACHQLSLAHPGIPVVVRSHRIGGLAQAV